MSYHPNQQTIEMVSFATEGNVIDHSWYHIIKRHSKTKSRTDSNAIMLLADIVYWHKPTHKIEENSGIHSIHKKYKADLLQKSYADMENQFGFTKDQARSAIETLEELGIVERVFRDFFAGTLKMTNVMYLKFNHKKLLELMKEYYQDPDKFKNIFTSSEKTDDPSEKNQTPPIKKPTYTEITPETSTDNELNESSDKIDIFDFGGIKKIIYKSDLHFMKAKNNLNWTEEEINILWCKIVNHKRPISNLLEFCKKIIENEKKLQFKQSAKPKKKERFKPESEKKTAEKQKLTSFEEYQKRKKYNE